MLFQRFLDDRNASVAPLLALAAVPLLGLIGASVDYGRASSAKATLQTAADSTALAVAQEIAKAATPLTDAQIRPSGRTTSTRSTTTRGPTPAKCRPTPRRRS